jgi:hypothetical protein
MVRSESHHHMFTKTLDGTVSLITRMSHNGQEISRDLATRMARQCALNTAEFWRLVDCPLTKEEWDGIIRERCADGRNPFIGH